MSPTPQTGTEPIHLRDGRLWVEGCDATALARSFGTPCYVISEAQLRRNARAYLDAFAAAWPEGPVGVLPSLKANSTFALRRILSEEGLGCDVFGHAELEAALRCGVRPELISLNGSTKSEALLLRAVVLGVRITVDSVRELELVRRAAGHAATIAHVRLRVRPDLGAIRCPSDFFADPVTVGDAVHAYKPGIPTEQLLGDCHGLIRAPELDVAGVMAHVGRHGRDPQIWRALVREMVAIMVRLRDAWDGWQPREFDVGGGFPSRDDPTARAQRGRHAGADDEEPSPHLYATAIAQTLRRELAVAGLQADGMRLEVEPGRAIYGDAGIHLARVLHVKRQLAPVARAWIETDTTQSFLPDVALERCRFTTVVADRANAVAELVADVVGCSCNYDVITEGARLPPVAAGDLVAFLGTGAYQDAGACSFNSLPRPATVLVRGADAEIVKRAETVDDVFARELGLPPVRQLTPPRVAPVVDSR